MVSYPHHTHGNGDTTHVCDDFTHVGGGVPHDGGCETQYACNTHDSSNAVSLCGDPVKEPEPVPINDEVETHDCVPIINEKSSNPCRDEDTIGLGKVGEIDQQIILIAADAQIPMDGNH